MDGCLRGWLEQSRPCYTTSDIECPTYHQAWQAGLTPSCDTKCLGGQQVMAPVRSLCILGLIF